MQLDLLRAIATLALAMAHSHSPGCTILIYSINSISPFWSQIFNLMHVGQEPRDPITSLPLLIRIPVL